MNMSSNKVDLTFLSKELPDIEFELYNSGKSPFISCIACWIKSADLVVRTWRPIQSLISAYYQPEDEISRWNIYIVIFCPEELPIRDKYVIQNDKYAARKIIIDRDPSTPRSPEAVTSINNELLGLDLSHEEQIPFEERNYNSVFSLLVSGVPSDMSVASKKLRQDRIDSLLQAID